MGEDGGGVRFSGGSLTLSDCAIAANEAVGASGGGLAFVGAELTISECSVTENEADDGFGGGIFASSPRQAVTMNVVVENSTISGNSAETGGGISTQTDHGDGGLEMKVEASTIAQNDATDGGGIFNERRRNRGEFAIVRFQSSIVADNRSGNCSNIRGIFESDGYNIEDADSCGLTADTDQPNGEPLLAPLALNGGSTWTHALMPGSDAIDSGDEGACPHNDQRGGARPVDGDQDGVPVCDIGSYEYRPQMDPGEPCASGAECHSGTCRGAACCAGACGGPEKSCGVSGQLGECIDTPPTTNAYGYEHSSPDLHRDAYIFGDPHANSFGDPDIDHDSNSDDHTHQDADANLYAAPHLSIHQRIRCKATACPRARALVAAIRLARTAFAGAIVFVARNCGIPDAWTERSVRVALVASVSSRVQETATAMGS